MEHLGEMGNMVFESIEKSTSAYVYVLDADRDLTRWSWNAVDNFDLPGKYVKQNDQVWGRLVHPEDKQEFLEDIRKVFEGEKDYHNCEYRVRKRNGEYVWVRCKGYATRDKDGRMRWFVGMVRELSRLNRIDYTTQLFNIYEFSKNINIMLESGSCDGGILLLGLDNFGKINTMYSYSFGDQVLSRVAETLQSMCPANVGVYRMEGDKFAYVCPRYSRKDVVGLFADVNKRLEHLQIAGGEELHLTMSAGALMLEDTYRDADDIYKMLEHTLSVSKQKKEEKVVTFFSQELLEETLKVLHLREELRHCVENGCEDFEVYYQPIMAEDGQTLYSCEALLRWQNDRFPDTGPSVFIPILEEMGLILEVGYWVADQAVKQLKEWRKILPGLKVNVNMSYMQFSSPDNLMQIMAILKQYHMPMDSIVLEVTESCDIKDVKEVVKQVEYLRAKGIQIALDDFGTGYSSIRVLQQIPADWIKLDHTFVSKITDNQFDRNIVKYLVGLCHSLGYKVCAEGVEDRMCLDMLQAEKVDAAQGYYYSRPIPPNQFYAKYIQDYNCAS